MSTNYPKTPDFIHRDVGVVFSRCDKYIDVPSKYALIYDGDGPGSTNPTIEAIRDRIEANGLACQCLLTESPGREVLIRLAIDSVLDENRNV